MQATSPTSRKIIITGTLQNAAPAVNKGANAYVIKPFDLKKMLQTIEEQLKKH